MKQKNILQTLIVTAAAAFGVATFAVPDDSFRPPVPASGAMGLLGQTYAGLTYSYLHLDASPVNASNYAFDYNQPLNTGLDAILNYNLTQLSVFNGYRNNEQTLDAALRAFSNSYSWGKPYVEAGVGYAWTRAAGFHDNSILWEAAVGVEFQVAPAVTVTPYIKYQDTPDIAAKDSWNFGVKGNYWVNSQWSVTAGLERNDHQDMKYTIGTNFRF